RTFKDAGDYTLTATLTDAAVNANYTLTNATYDVSIAAKEIAVVWTLPQGGYVYNGADQIASLQGVATANTGIENETVTLTVVADKSFKDADDYVLTADQTNPNYTLTNEETQATIAPKTITIDFNSTGKTATYGDEDEWDALGDEMQDNAMYLVTEDETALADLGGAPLVIIASYRFDTQADGSGTSVSMADVGPELAAGTYYLIVTSTDDNYVFEVAEGFVEKAILVVTKATLTVTAKDRTVKYGEQKGALTIGDVTIEGFVNGEGVGSLGGTLSFSCGYAVGAAAGNSYDISVGGFTSSNYEINFVKGTLTVAKRELVLTYKHDAPISYVYGDASVYQLNPYEHVNIGGDGFAPSDLTLIAANGEYIKTLVPITVAVGSNKATAQPLLQINGSNFGYVQTYWLYLYTPGVGANYTVTNNLDDNAKLVISKKALTLTANDATVPYGNEAPEFTVSTEDFAYDDATKAFNVVFSGTLSFVCDYNAGDAVGNSYDVMPSGVTAGNYEVSFAPGTLTVVKRSVIIGNSNTQPLSYVYGDASVYGLNPASVITLGGDGLAQGDQFSDIATLTLAVGADKATASPITSALSGSNFGYAATYWLYLFIKANENYEVTSAFDDNAKLVIAKKPLTVTAENKSVKYGEEAPEFTVSYDGFAYDDATKAFNLVFSGTLAYDCDYQPGTSVGTVGITPKDITAGNYEINFVPGALTVTPREITVSNTNDASFSYVYGDNAVYGLATTMGSIVTVSGDGFADGDDFASVGVLTLAVGANKATASPITSALSATNFGYAATYWLCVIPTNDNYVITDGFNENAKVVISKKALTITADDKTVAYGDTAPSFTVTYDGFVGGNYNDGPAKLTGTLAFTCAYDITDATNRAVGEYTVIPYGVTNGNYDITFVPGTLTVETRLVTLTWGETNLVYNKAEQAPSVTVGNVVYGETVAVEVTGAASTVGTYTATAAISDENYRLPIDNTKAFAIAKKAITVTAEDKESNLNYDLVQLTAIVQGILEGDEVFTLSTTADKNVAGEYPIVVTLTGNDNYDVTAVNGTYTVKSNVTVIDDKDGTKVVEGKETVDKDAAKEGEGVSIKNMIKNVIDAAAEAPVANLSIEIGNGATITFNKAALVELAKADDVRIIYSETLGVDVDRSNKDLKNAELVINVSLGDVTFDGGLATVTTSFNNDAPLGKRAVVYYVDENGKKTDMKAIFKDGTVTFTTGHFSTYTVEYVWKTGALVANIVASIVAFALIVLLIFFIIKKIKNKKNKP
ncbi:MAG: hypothetical protein IK037_01030, partial [Clostridia bacterium]|nr:hypothetical protein [Clostridia bacterium]